MREVAVAESTSPASLSSEVRKSRLSQMYETFKTQFEPELAKENDRAEKAEHAKAELQDEYDLLQSSRTTHEHEVEVRAENQKKDMLRNLGAKHAREKKKLADEKLQLEEMIKKKDDQIADWETKASQMILQLKGYVQAFSLCQTQGPDDETSTQLEHPSHSVLRNDLELVEKGLHDFHYSHLTDPAPLNMDWQSIRIRVLECLRNDKHISKEHLASLSAFFYGIQPSGLIQLIMRSTATYIAMQKAFETPVPDFDPIELPKLRL